MSISLDISASPGGIGGKRLKIRSGRSSVEIDWLEASLVRFYGHALSAIQRGCLCVIQLDCFPLFVSPITITIGIIIIMMITCPWNLHFLELAHYLFLAAIIISIIIIIIIILLL